MEVLGFVDIFLDYDAHILNYDVFLNYDVLSVANINKPVKARPKVGFLREVQMNESRLAPVNKKVVKEDIL